VGEPSAAQFPLVTQIESKPTTGGIHNDVFTFFFYKKKGKEKKRKWAVLL
jgi:hypothetical protein